MCMFVRIVCCDVCVCVCVCVFVFAYVCCNRMRAHLCERARGPVFADVCMHVRMRVYAHTYMYLYV